MRLVLPRRMTDRVAMDAFKKQTTESEIHSCVYKNDIEAVKTCLQINPSSINIKNEHGMAPLTVAASLNRYDVMKLLMTSSCDVMLRDNDGNTALHEAVDQGHATIVKLLIEHDKKIVDVQNNRGETALMRAAFYDYVEIAAILIKTGGATLDLKDNQLQSALLIGLREGSHMTVDLLLKSGSDVTVINSVGQTALYIAIYSPCNRTLDLARTLIAHGYDLANDKMWLLNEEKHNLFYQDDDFYSILRRKLRNNSNDHSMVNNVAYHAWSYSPDNSNLRPSTSSAVSSATSPTLLSRQQSHMSQYPKNDKKPRLTSSFSSTTSSTSTCASTSLSPTSQIASPLSPLSSPFVMSPTLRQKIMNADGPRFPRCPILTHTAEEPTRCMEVASMKQRTRLRQARSITFQKSSSTESNESDISDSVFVDPKIAKVNTITDDQPILTNCSASPTSVSAPCLKQDVITSDEPVDTTLSAHCATVPKQADVIHANNVSENHANASKVGFRKRNDGRSLHTSDGCQTLPSVTYKRQFSVQLPQEQLSNNSAIMSRQTSVPVRPSVHFSTEIKVINVG